VGAGESRPDINAKGGVKLSDGLMHKIVLKYADDKSDPTAAPRHGAADQGRWPQAHP
jgi:hypothetical protein